MSSCDTTTLQRWAWEGKNSSTFPQRPPLLVTGEFQAKDPRHICQCPSCSEAHTNVSLLPFPLGLIQVCFTWSSYTSFQAHPFPEVPWILSSSCSPKENVFLPSNVACQGLLDSSDIPLRLFNLLHCLEEADTQGLLGALASMVDLFAVPLWQCHPSSLLPSALPSQFLI